MAKGLIINVTADSVIRLLPPMIMSDKEADQVVDILVPLIRDFQRINRVNPYDYQTFSYPAGPEYR